MIRFFFYYFYCFSFHPNRLVFHLEFILLESIEFIPFRKKLLPREIMHLYKFPIYILLYILQSHIWAHVDEKHFAKMFLIFSLYTHEQKYFYYYYYYNYCYYFSITSNLTEPNQTCLNLVCFESNFFLIKPNSI